MAEGSGDMDDKVRNHQSLFQPGRVITPAKIVVRGINTTDSGYLLGLVTLVACGEPGVTLLDITRMNLH